jgi:hypothetical protein
VRKKTAVRKKKAPVEKKTPQRPQDQRAYLNSIDNLVRALRGEVAAVAAQVGEMNANLLVTSETVLNLEAVVKTVRSRVYTHTNYMKTSDDRTAEWIKDGTAEWRAINSKLLELQSRVTGLESSIQTIAKYCESTTARPTTARPSQSGRCDVADLVSLLGKITSK